MDNRINAATRNSFNFKSISPVSSSLDNSIIRFVGNTGTYIQDSLVTIDDSGNIVTSGTITASASIIDGIQLGNNDTLAFGDSSDISMTFNGTNFISTSTGTANMIFKLGEDAGVSNFQITDSNDATQVLFSSDGLGSMDKLGLGTSSVDTSAILELDSTTGALLLSRMTSTQRDALTAVNGMMLYNSTTSTIQAYQGSSWASIGSGGVTNSWARFELTADESSGTGKITWDTVTQSADSNFTHSAGDINVSSTGTYMIFISGTFSNASVDERACIISFKLNTTTLQEAGDHATIGSDGSSHLSNATICTIQTLTSGASNDYNVEFRSLSQDTTLLNSRSHMIIMKIA